MTKILLIEDDLFLSDMYKRTFEFEGFEVFVARDGQDGLNLASSANPDIILLDYMMPKMSGMQVLDALKANPATKHLAIVMLTNLTGPHDAEIAIKHGALDYLVKSQYDPEQLVEVVQRMLANLSAATPTPLT